MNATNRKSISELLRAKTGTSIAKFAKNNHTTRQSVYEAMDGRGSRRIRVKIAKAIGIPPSMVWEANNRATKIADDLDYLGC